MARSTTLLPLWGLTGIYLYAVVLLWMFVMPECSAEREHDDIKRLKVVAGGNITLTCYAQANQLRAYRWVYIRTGTKRPQVLSSGRQLVVGEPRLSLDTKVEDGNITLKLTLSDIRPYESGIFMCWRQGLQPDPQILLTVLEPGASPERQVITKLEGPSEVKYGDPATFTCTISPSWPIKVTWLKDGIEIPVTDRLYTQTVETRIEPVNDSQAQDKRQEATEQLLATLSVATVRMDANFTCRIATDPPEERSFWINVRVPRVVSLTSEPDKDTVQYGQSLTLTCVVSGSDSEVVWLKNGLELLFGQNFPGRQKYSSEKSPNMMASTVYIESVSVSDNGHYVCYIPGASRFILINLEGRPARLLGVTGGNFFEDEPLILSCRTQYAKDTQQSAVSWKFHDELLDPSQYESRVSHSDYNVTVHELIIERAGEAHAGTYECVTPYGSAAVSADMYVPPFLSEPLPSELLIKEGEELYINCRTTGRPQPVVHWEKKIGESWLPVNEIIGRDADVDGVLTAPLVSVSDAGHYRCAAKSTAGSFLAEVTVTVERASPEVFDMVAPESVLVGDNFTVQCTIMNWDGEVEFIFEGVSLNSRLNSRYSVILYPEEDSVLQAYLIVQEAKLEDAGSYMCIAGPQASASVTVEITKRPGEIVNLVVSPAVEGEDFFVSCTVRNWLEEVRFYHKGNILSEDIDPRYSVYIPDTSLQDVTHVLKVASARVEDEGTYHCYLDIYNTRTVEVALKHPVQEVLGVSATAAILGRTFNVSCSVRSWDESVTFLFNDVVVEPDNDWRYKVFVRASDTDSQEVTHVLSVSSATLEDSGSYECYTTPATSASTYVTVWNVADVTLGLQFQDQPNWKDSPVPINCEVRGVDPNTVTILFSHYDNPQVSIQNRTKMSTSNHLVNIAIGQGEEDSVPLTIFTLGFYSLTKDLEGLWSCEVLHPSGESLGSDTLFMEIEETPEFINPPPKEVYEVDGADLFLNCSVTGSPDTMVAWYREGIPEPIEFGRLSASLFIPRFTTTDEGSYYCRAALHNREIQTSTILKLRTPQPRVESVVASPATVGGEFTITCTTSSWNEQVLFIYNREPADLNEGSRYSVSSQLLHNGKQRTTEHVLRVKHATLQDSGIVECFLTPDIFGSTEVIVKEDYGLLPTPISTEVFGLPKPTISLGRIVELRGPDTVEEGATLLLTCLVSPVVQQDIVLIHDIFILHSGYATLTEDPRIEIMQDVSADGSRLLYLRISQVRKDDGGEYQCVTSTKPPAYSVFNVLIVPGDTYLNLPEVSTTEATYLPTTTEGKTTGVCEFPSQWIGSWYQTDLDQKVTIAAHEFGKSTCVNSSSNSYLVQHLKKECYRCIQITEQHQNLLQYKKSKCKKTQVIEDVCATITRYTDLHTMIRMLAEPSHCPFIGPRKFTYELPQGECSESLSEIISYKESELNFMYAPCEDLSRYDPGIISEEFDCIANWTDGTTYYLIGKLRGPFLSLEERYRCFTYIQEKNASYVYQMSHGNSATCGVLGKNFNKAYKIFSIVEEEPLLLTGSQETNLTLQPSQEVKLTCEASVQIDFDEVYFFRKYYMKWTREVNNEDEVITFDENVLHNDSTRFSIQTDNVIEGTTKYDLIISPLKVSDAGIYTCSLNNINNTLVTHKIFLSMAEPPHYDSCELPDHWTGEWWTPDQDYTIIENNFGESSCTLSLGNSFLMKEKTDCHSCFIITESHHNILHYQKSLCINSEDLNTVCSTIDNNGHIDVMVRKNAIDTCPFPGSRSFTYQLAHKICSERHSQLFSNNNDTELLFLYNPCQETSPKAALQSEHIACVAQWSEDSIHFFMGKLKKNEDSREQFYCYTYETGTNTDFVYQMAKTGSEVCGDLKSTSGPTYKVFAESQEPEPPVIEENADTSQVQVGDSIRLTCTSSGGLPPATLIWFRNDKEIPSETQQVKGISKAYLDITVEESDRGAEFRCKASNFVTVIPLSTATVLTFQKGFKNIMVPQIVAVEDQTSFLPCAQTSEEDIKMEWFDADLDYQITSDNEILTQDPNYYPYIKNGILGLVVIKSFLDTTYGCSLDGQKLGNTTLVILPQYLFGVNFEDIQKYFEDSDTKLQVDEGKSVTVDCSLKGNMPSALVSWWHYPGSSLLTQGRINIAEAKSYKLKVSDNSYLLTITNASLSHSGLYVCQFAINEREIYRKNFTVYVDGLVWVQLGENASIRCYSPTGDWVKFVYKEEDILQLTLNNTEKYVWEMSEETDEPGAIIILTIIDVNEDDLGTYTCKDIKDSFILQETQLKIFLQGESSTISLPSPEEEIYPWSTSEISEEATEAYMEEVTTETSKEDEEVTGITKEDEFTTKMAEVEISTEIVKEGEWEYSDEIEEIPILEPVTTVVTSTTTEATSTLTAISSTTTSATSTTTATTSTTTPSTTSSPTITTTTTTTTIPPVIYEEVILSCEGHNLEDITWKQGIKPLFLGGLDVANIPGLLVSYDGELILAKGPHKDIRDNDTYVCFVDTFDDEIAIATYHVSLIGDETVIEGRVHDTRVSIPVVQPEEEEEDSVPSPDLEFSDLKEEEVAVLANSERIGKRIFEVLQSGGLNVKLLEETVCSAPSETRAWSEAQAALKECEYEARSSGNLLSNQSVFIGIDFFVELIPSSWFAVTQLHVHDIKKNISVDVFAPMVPVPSSDIIQPSQPNEPVLIMVSESWWNTVQGADSSYGNGLTASILSLQESYRSLLNEDDSP